MKKVILLPLTWFMLVSSLEAQTGVIRGKIRESLSGKPVEFATVQIEGTSIGAQTDSTGSFLISAVKPTVYNIKVSCLGYKAKTVAEIEVTNSKPAVLNIDLEEANTEIKEVEVRATPFVQKEESPVSVRSIGVNEIQRYPGGNRDISRVVQSLPGVGFSTGFRNDLIIRGGSPAENKFYLDDIEIPNINHFSTQGGSGGPVGLINVDFIREVNFFTSAFPSDRGNTLSSLMDVRLKDGRDDRWGGTVTLGITDAAISMESPLNKKKSATILASLRTSYYDWFFKLIDLPIFPNYTDGQLKIKWRIDAKNDFEFLSLSAFDIFKLNLAVKSTEDNLYALRTIPAQNQYSTTNGIKYNHYFNNSNLQVVLSSNELFNSIYKYKNNSKDSVQTQHYKSTESETKIRVEYTARKKGWKFNVGGNYEVGYYYNRSKFIGEFFSYNYQTDLVLNRYGLFGSMSKRFAKDKLLLSLGLRLDGNTYNGSMANPLNQTSPRFSFSYNFAKNFRLNFNTGYYHEVPAYTILGYRDSTNTLVNKPRSTYVRNIHLVLGIEYNTKFNSRASIEGFYKQYYNTPFLLDDSISLANKGADFGVVGNAPAASTSKGRAYGTELLYEQKLFKGWYGIVAYTLFWSQFQDRNNHYAPSSWDTRHIISITAGKKFKHEWEIGARFRVQGGKPFSPFNVGYSSLIPVFNANPQGVPDYSQLNSQTLPWFHQLDIRITKKWYFKKWALELYLDIQNVYFHQLKDVPNFSLDLDANGNSQLAPGDPTRYKTKLLPNTSGILQPGLGLIISY